MNEFPFDFDCNSPLFSVSDDMAIDTRENTLEDCTESGCRHADGTGAFHYALAVR